MEKKLLKGLNLKTAIVGMIVSVFACQSFALTYYVDPVKGSDTNMGTEQYPWKTLSYAHSNKSGIAAGDTVILKSGNYGVVNFANQSAHYGVAVYGTSWDAPITYQAASGANVVFQELRLMGHSDEATKPMGLRRYLIFKDIEIVNTTTNACITVNNASHIKFQNIKATGKWDDTYATGISSAGISVSATGKHDHRTEDIYIEDSDFGWVLNGIDIGTNLGENIIIRNCIVHDVAASGIKFAQNTTNSVALVEGCEVYNQWPTRSSPTNSDFTHGSGFSIRRSNLTIRSNIVHNYGTSRSLRTYQDVYPNVGYSNITFENNLVYDPKNYYPVEFLDIGENFKFNNNTIVGSYRTNGDWSMTTERYGLGVWFRPALQWSTGAGFEFFNNVIVGSARLDFAAPFAFKEDNNIIWGYTSNKIIGDNTKIIAYGTYPNYTVTDINYFEGSGNFFVGGTLFDQYSYMDTLYTKTNTHGQNLNEAYKLAPGSEGIGFGNLAKAPTTDLEFNVRDASPDAGCYEDSDGTTPTEPIEEPTETTVELTIDPINSQSVIEGQAVSFDVTYTVSGASASDVNCVMENIPAGATFANNQFNWTPQTGQSGLYFLKLSAACQDANDVAYVSVSVSENPDYHAPVFDDIGIARVKEAEKIYLKVTATDPDGDDVKVTATNLPPGAIYHNDHLIWVPEYGTAGTYKMIFTASDGVNRTEKIKYINVDTASETYLGRRLIYYWETTLSLLGEI